METEKKECVLLGEGTGEITEKKSRFIAHCYEIHSEEDALKHIEELRKTYWDAKHNCYAYVLGGDSLVQRFSDDKEPQGTAGKPILEVLLNRGISNALIVVTRYFGGILLGTGGLVRAYSSAAAEGLKSCTVSEVYRGSELLVTCDYSLLGKMQYIAGQLSDYGVCTILDTLYASEVSIRILAERKLLDSLKNKITEASSGKAVTETKSEVAFAMNDGKPVFLSWPRSKQKPR